MANILFAASQAASGNGGKQDVCRTFNGKLEPLNYSQAMSVNKRLSVFAPGNRIIFSNCKPSLFSTRMEA